MVAAGALSSQAQNVFSQNVVGYVQQVFTNGIFYMISNPLDNGTNTVPSVLTGAHNGTAVDLFNGVGYDVVTLGFGGWSSNAPISPGKGFFVSFGGPVGGLTTNTFLGNVVVSIGNSGTNTLAASGFGMYGSLIPYSDSITNTTTVNLGPVLQNGDNIQKWDVPSQTLTVYSLGFGGWSPSVPSIGVGEGFFLNNNHAAKSWVQTLPAQ